MVRYKSWECKAFNDCNDNSIREVWLPAIYGVRRAIYLLNATILSGEILSVY